MHSMLRAKGRLHFSICNNFFLQTLSPCTALFLSALLAVLVLRRSQESIPAPTITAFEEPGVRRLLLCDLRHLPSLAGPWFPHLNGKWAQLELFPRVFLRSVTVLYRKINTRGSIRAVLLLWEISLFKNEILIMLQLCLEQRNKCRKGLLKFFFLFSFSQL